MKPIEKQPAYLQVADQIRRAIQLGQYVCNDRLPTEKVFAEQLGVSRTTLREAISHLEGEGYIQARPGPHGGVYVAQKDIALESQLATLRKNWDDIEHLFDFRIAVECAAAGIAAETRTEADLEAMRQANRGVALGKDHSERRASDAAFHLAVSKATGNRYFQRAVEDARAGMFRPLDVYGFSFDMWDGQSDEHQAVYEAIAARDRGAAERAMRDHIQGARDKIRKMILGRPKKIRK